MKRTDPDLLTPEQLRFLSDALRRSPSNKESLADILADARSGDGEIYASDHAATYIEFLPEVMNVVLLGGKDIKEWRESWNDFVLNLMRERNIKTLCIIGRTGWMNIFPELTPIGMLYVFHDEGGAVARDF